MLSRLGALIYHQLKEITVYDYTKVIVYEIFHNNRFLHVIENKETGEFTINKKEHKLE